MPQLPHVSLPLTLKTAIDNLFYQEQQLLLQCSELVFFTHIHAHSALPGPLSFGNATIDALLYPIEAAKQEHLLQHTNSKGYKNLMLLLKNKLKILFILVPYVHPLLYHLPHQVST